MHASNLSEGRSGSVGDGEVVLVGVGVTRRGQLWHKAVRFFSCKQRVNKDGKVDVCGRNSCKYKHNQVGRETFYLAEITGLVNLISSII
jgi:hypothetical protein